MTCTRITCISAEFLDCISNIWSTWVENGGGEEEGGGRDKKEIRRRRKFFLKMPPKYF